ncbi:hypothetical protein HPB48_023540 [Haemaphysalis longicornis]|uniref:Ras-related protein Rab n=1 Tax=Haemaphysalis longicornis TaxID=44386 RepID=A0A9J6H5G4_HAELO|nr:hypothetical protein HPB48_023540 [Haemaphysalis longicornis]
MAWRRAQGTMSGPQREHLYKILVIGELGTGKTSIIKRYVHQFFSHHYRATIGVDFALKVLEWDANTLIRLQLWDIAGDQRYQGRRHLVFEQFFRLFSSTIKNFSLLRWASTTMLMMSVGTCEGVSYLHVLFSFLLQCDMSKEGIVNNPSAMNEFCKENNFAGWFLTSAKENLNIEEAARFLITQILNNQKGMNLDDSGQGSVPLDGTPPLGQSVPRRTCC